MSEVIPEPIPLDGREPAPEPTPEPAWAGPDQGQWESVMGYIQQQQAEREAWEQQQYAAQQQYAPQPQYDPAALDDPFHEQHGFALRQELAAMRQEMASYREYQEQAQLGEGEERALDILEDVVSRDGDFLDNERAFAQARALANIYFQEEVQKSGWGPQSAEAALVRAANDVREYEKTVRERAVAQHLNQLKSLSGAPNEPGSTYAQGIQERTMPNYREGGSVSGRMFGGG